MEHLYCPDCGNSQFTATLTTRTEYTYNVFEHGAPVELSREVVDGGSLDEIDEFACSDCGATFDDLDSDHLATASEYAREDEG